MPKRQLIKEAKRPDIEVNGHWGTFLLEDADFAVHYFQTYASPDAKGGGPYFELLRHLAPMRERVTPAALRDLDSLLQRDLSDERIAQELVPYLLGRRSKVGFFPPVVAVLMPKGFVGVEKGAPPSYPGATRVGDNVLTFGDGWGLELFREGGGRVGRLGQLRIDHNNTDVIVLDGQHRANAFRYVAGCFDPGDKYRAFYGKARPDGELQSDLPVTIIWFEAAKKGKKLSPTHVSRELFVTVNNTVRKVSEARTVLLDDVTIAHLGVNTYYRAIALNRGYGGGEGLDLLAASFDFDRDLADSSIAPMSLTSPIHLAQGLRTAFWGNAMCDELGERAPVGAPALVRFSKIFKNPSYLPKSNELDSLRIVDDKLRGQFRVDFAERYAPVLDQLFSAPSFLRAHYRARTDLEAELQDYDKVGSELQTVWTSVFVGGEGLYGAYMRSELPTTAHRRAQIREIDNRFRGIRASLYTDEVGRTTKKEADDLRASINQVYESFATVAFQTAFLMTVDFVAQSDHRNDWEKSAEVIGKKCGNVGYGPWLVFFNEFRDWYVGGVDPRAWPKYRKMLLTLLGYSRLFKGDATPPITVMVKTRVKELCWSALEAGTKLGAAKMQAFVDQAVSEAKDVYARIGAEVPVATKSLESIGLVHAQETKEEYE